MFSRFFSQNASGGRDKTRPKSRSRPSSSQTIQENSAANRIVNSDAERQMYRFDMPEQQRGMTDLIDQHKTGNRFQYVALTGSTVEEHGSRIRRLVGLQPAFSSNQIPIRDLPRLRLYNDSERFPLSNAIPIKGKEFIMLVKATMIFTPLSSFTDDYTEIKTTLLDMRMRSKPERASVKSTTNISARSEFSMDHCIPRSDADKLSLIFTREAGHMTTGTMWGVVQVQLEIMESDFPYSENMQETIAVLALPSSGLDKFDKDPMHLDVSLHENHKSRLQDLYQVGEIANEAEPQMQKTAKLTYAKSSAPARSAMKKTTDMVPEVQPTDWSHIGGFKTQIADDQASIEPEDSDDGSDIPLPSPPTPIKRASSLIFSDPDTLVSDSGRKKGVSFGLTNL